MDLHRVRGEKFSPPTAESVEWLNALLKTVWGLINPDMYVKFCYNQSLQIQEHERVLIVGGYFFRFISLADMVEDIMQASLPSFIVRPIALKFLPALDLFVLTVVLPLPKQDSVKLSDLGQGTNPVRIVAMRGLPDQPGDPEYPREEWIDQGKPPQLTAEEQANKKEEGTEDASLEDQSGDYVVRFLFFLFRDPLAAIRR